MTKVSSIAPDFHETRARDVPEYSGRDPRAPEALTYDEQFAGDAVNTLGDQDAANASAPSVPDLPDIPTAQSVRRHPDFYDDDVKAEFGLKIKGKK